jgi:hypothetical protein
MKQSPHFGFAQWPPKAVLIFRVDYKKERTKKDRSQETV